MVQSLQFSQHGGRVRRSGVIEEVALAHSWRRIDFAGGARRVIIISMRRVTMGREQLARVVDMAASRSG